MRPSSVAYLKLAFLKFALLSLLLGGADSGLLNRFWRAGGDAPRAAETMPRRDARRAAETTPRRDARKKDHHLHVHRRKEGSSARAAETPPEKKEETPQTQPASTNMMTTQRPFAGRALLAADAFQCHECPGDTFCFQDALTRCPEHAVSANRSDDAGDCRCKAGFWGAANASAALACQACPPDFYCAGGAAREACPAGAHSPAGSPARAGCVCGAGFAGLAAARGWPLNASELALGELCVACAAGAYKAESGGGACAPCAAGTFAAESGAAACAACPANTVSAPGAALAAACVAAPGAFGAPGAAASLCAAGTYAERANASACEPCPSYAYLPSTGASSVQACLACPDGAAVYAALADDAGAAAAPNGVGVRAADCVCAPGRELRAGGGHDAGILLYDSFNSFNESLECAPCAAGAHKALAGNGPCAPCAAGTYAAAGGARCLPCPANSSSAAGAAGARNCSCDAGHALDEDPSLNDPSFFALGAGGDAPDFACRACAPGTFQAAAGASACEACAGGHYQAAAGQSACLECGEDRFVPETGPGASCVSCGAHEVAPRGSAGAGACRCRGGYARGAWVLGAALWPGGPAPLLGVANGDGDLDGDGDCVACPAGYFRNASAAREACEACPAGWVAGAAGAAGAGAEDCAPCDVGAYSLRAAEGVFCRACPAHANTSALSGADDDPSFIVDDAFAHTVDACRCGAGFFRNASADAAAALAAIGAGSASDIILMTLAGALALEGGVPCAACARGKFKAAPGHAACTPCPAGTGGADRGPEDDPSLTMILLDAACVPCGAGTFSALVAGAQGPVFECAACPPHSTSAVGSAAAENCSCVAGFAFAGLEAGWGPGGGALAPRCEACAAGWFRAEGPGADARAPCGRCARGSYALGGAAACSACPANTTTAAEGAPNGSACVCAPGFFQHVEEGQSWAGACARCAPGSFSTGLGAATCDDCGAAAFLARDAAPGERACVPCPGNASAVPRALGVEGCVALAGFVRVAGAGARVELAVLWPGSAAAFAAAEAAFRRGLAAAGAAACGCGAASARVARVTAAAAARRLLQDFVEGVVVEVELGVADAGSGAQLAASLTAAGINAALAQEGVAPVSAIVSGPTLLASAEFGPCPADAYCPTQDTVVACPPNTSAPAGSAREEECRCLPGFAGAARNCSLCAVDHFCPGGGLAALATPEACPANASTRGRVGARAPADCVCDAGWMPGAGDDDQSGAPACVVCPADSFCHGEARVACPAHSSAPRGATSVADCACDSGRFRTACAHDDPSFDDPSFSAAAGCVACAACPPTSVCHAGGAVEVCAANASNVNFACRCAVGCPSFFYRCDPSFIVLTETSSGSFLTETSSGSF
jgi:hypothetical protein